jgi:hypothetical protein
MKVYALDLAFIPKSLFGTPIKIYQNDKGHIEWILLSKKYVIHLGEIEVVTQTVWNQYQLHCKKGFLSLG